MNNIARLSGAHAFRRQSRSRIATWVAAGSPSDCFPAGVGAPSGEQRKRSSSGGRLSFSEASMAEEKARYILRICPKGERDGKHRSHPSSTRRCPTIRRSARPIGFVHRRSSAQLPTGKSSTGSVSPSTGGSRRSNAPIWWQPPHKK